MKRHIIPIFVPHWGCPHQCVFCNQKKITGIACPMDAMQAKAIIDEALSWQTRAGEREVAFYGGSFTAIPTAKQRELLAVVTPLRRAGVIDGIRLSTRPDAIDSGVLNLLQEHMVTTIELGVQSMDDTVLEKANRGHTSADVVNAVSEIRKHSFQLGLQIMPGLPGEDYLSLIRTANAIRQLQPDFVRIYPTVVIADTPLANAYQKGLYQPLNLAEAVKRTAFLKLLFERAGISVIRMGLQATEEMNQSDTVLAGPYHPAFGELVEAELFRQMMVKALDGKMLLGKAVIIHHHPSDASKVRGQKKANISYLCASYGLAELVCCADGQHRNEIVIEIDGIRYTMNFSMIDRI